MVHADSDTEDSFSADEDGGGSSRIIGMSKGMDPASPLIQTSPGDNTDAAAKASSETEEGGEEEGGEQGEGATAKDNSNGEGGRCNGSDGKEEDRGDPEMAPVYLRRLLPIFTEIYHSSLAPALRRESLRLMRKMTHYVTSACLQDLCRDALPADPSRPPFSAQISEVMAAVLESEDDHEGHLSALHIMQELLVKNRPAFDEQFVRLGLPTKIGALAGPVADQGVDEKKGSWHVGGGEKEEGAKGDDCGAFDVSTESKDERPKEIDSGENQTPKKRRSRSGKSTEKKLEDVSTKKEVKIAEEDATEISVSVPYQWRDWCIIRSRDCLYLWNSYCVIELSNVSNGWFRFLVDNRLATMYSSGSTEGGPGSYGKGRH